MTHQPRDFMTGINPVRIVYAERNLHGLSQVDQKKIIIGWVLEEVGYLTYAEAEFLIAAFGLKGV